MHTDSTRTTLNHAVSARAFATGTDVYFAQGEYKPGTADGDKLIAHELAHVVQQRGAADQRPADRVRARRRDGAEADSVADSDRADRDRTGGDRSSASSTAA